MGDVYFTDTGYKQQSVNTSLYEQHPVFTEHYVPRAKITTQEIRPVIQGLQSATRTLLRPNAPVAPAHTEHHEDFHNFLKTSLKNASKYIASDTEIVTESIVQHKYARLANSSYDYFNSKGKIDAVHEGLKKFDYIPDLKDFRVDEELSTIDNLVLHNAPSGETHISYRGTTDNPMRTKNFLNDWMTNVEITGGSTHSTRVRQALSQFDRVVSKYGKQNLTTSGHSQGGHISYEISVKNDVAGHHYNPAINGTQVSNVERFIANEAEQIVYKTTVDFASPLAYNNKLKKSNTKLKVIQNIESAVVQH
jgi:hypothetical protein